MSEQGNHSSHFPRTLIATRYIVLIPIIGLGLAAIMLFVFGGFNLLKLVFETSLAYLGLEQPHVSSLPIYVEIIEYVHTFLIGTVLYLTAVGFYQLFIGEVQFPRWLQVHNTEELETNLIGVAAVVLAINFMGLSFNKNGDYLLRYGAGIALPIAALGLFMGMRAWARKMEQDSGCEEGAVEARLKALEEKVLHKGGEFEKDR